MIEEWALQGSSKSKYHKELKELRTELAKLTPPPDLDVESRPSTSSLPSTPNLGASTSSGLPSASSSSAQMTDSPIERESPEKSVSELGDKTSNKRKSCDGEMSSDDEGGKSPKKEKLKSKVCHQS